MPGLSIHRLARIPQPQPDPGTTTGQAKPLKMNILMIL